jgi:ribonuclease P protein component
MKRAWRLRSAADFQRVRARRRSWAHPLLILYVADSPAEQSRVGLVVGRRVGNAVTRNRVKRRMREAMRARYATLPRPVDLVWIARPAAAEADQGALQAAVDQLLRGARLWRDRSGDPGARPR